MGIIPKAAAAGGILSGFDREHLLEKDIQLAPTPRERAFIQKVLSVFKYDKAEGIFNSKLFPRGFEGKAIRPSYLIGQIKKCIHRSKYRKHLTAV